MSGPAAVGRMAIGVAKPPPSSSARKAGSDIRPPNSDPPSRRRGIISLSGRQLAFLQTAFILSDKGGNMTSVHFKAILIRKGGSHVVCTQRERPRLGGIRVDPCFGCHRCYCSAVSPGPADWQRLQHDQHHSLAILQTQTDPVKRLSPGAKPFYYFFSVATHIRVPSVTTSIQPLRSVRSRE